MAHRQNRGPLKVTMAEKFARTNRAQDWDTFEKRADEPKIDAKSSVWEVYNRSATKIDRELMKDWNDILNTLLIFVSFSYILPRSRHLLVTGRTLLGHTRRFHH
jgi:hypothetical protein